MTTMTMDAARTLADEIASAMHHYPMLLRTTPPRVMDIDEAFARVRGLRVLHVAAVHPDRRFD